MGVSKNPKINDQDSAIAKIYDTLVHDLGAGQQATRGIFDQGNASMAGAYQGAADQLRGAQGSMTGRLASSLGDLGLGAALPSVMQPINEQFGYDQGQIAKERATDLGSLSKQGTQYQAIGQVGINNANKEKAQTRASALQSLTDLLSQLEAENEQVRSQGAVELAKVRAEAADRAASRGGGGSDDPLDALRAQKMGLEIQGMEQDLMGGGKPVEYHNGQRGANEFLDSPSVYWGDNGADPATRSRFNDIINTTARYRGQPTFNVGGKVYYTKGMDPLEIATIGAGHTKEHGINKEALRMALQLYYGK